MNAQGFFGFVMDFSVRTPGTSMKKGTPDHAVAADVVQQVLQQSQHQHQQRSAERRALLEVWVGYSPGSMGVGAGPALVASCLQEAETECELPWAVWVWPWGVWGCLVASWFLVLGSYSHFAVPVLVPCSVFCNFDFTLL